MWKKSKLQPLENAPRLNNPGLLDDPQRNNLMGPRVIAKQSFLQKVDEQPEVDASQRENYAYVEKNKSRRNILDNQINRNDIPYLEKGHPTEYLQDYRDEELEYLARPEI